MARCRTPRKRAFRDALGATVWAARVTQLGHSAAEPYECPCGRWHIREIGKRRARR